MQIRKHDIGNSLFYNCNYSTNRNKTNQYQLVTNQRNTVFMAEIKIYQNLQCILSEVQYCQHSRGCGFPLVGYKQPTEILTTVDRGLSSASKDPLMTVTRVTTSETPPAALTGVTGLNAITNLDGVASTPSVAECVATRSRTGES
jgi:hypothetical protein